MSSSDSNKRIKLISAAAAAAGGILIAALALLRPAWLSPGRTAAGWEVIPLPQSYSSGTVFDGSLIDTQPTVEQLNQILDRFDSHVQQLADDLGFSSEQCADLGAVAAERLQGMLDPSFERDYTRAVKRGLLNPRSDLASQYGERKVLIERLRLAPFGINSTIIVPHVHPDGTSFQPLRSLRGIGYRNYRLRSPPKYDQTGIRSSSPTVEVLFPVRVSVLDMETRQFTTSPSAVVVLGFQFVWAEAESRKQWVPQEYFMYEYGDPLDDKRYKTIGFPMSF